MPLAILAGACLIAVLAPGLGVAAKRRTSAPRAKPKTAIARPLVRHLGLKPEDGAELINARVADDGVTLDRNLVANGAPGPPGKDGSFDGWAGDGDAKLSASDDGFILSADGSREGAQAVVSQTDDRAAPIDPAESYVVSFDLEIPRLRQGYLVVQIHFLDRERHVLSQYREFPYFSEAPKSRQIIFLDPETGSHLGIPKNAAFMRLKAFWAFWGGQVDNPAIKHLDTNHDGKADEPGPDGVATIGRFMVQRRNPNQSWYTSFVGGVFPSGEVRTAPFDAGRAVDPVELKVDCTGQVEAQLRAADTAEELARAKWGGADGPGTRFRSSGGSVPSQYAGHRLFQVRLLLSAAASKTPVVRDVSLSYRPSTLQVPPFVSVRTYAKEQRMAVFDAGDAVDVRASVMPSSPDDPVRSVTASLSGPGIASPAAKAMDAAGDGGYRASLRLPGSASPGIYTVKVVAEATSGLSRTAAARVRVRPGSARALLYGMGEPLLDLPDADIPRAIEEERKLGVQVHREWTGMGRLMADDAALRADQRRKLSLVLKAAGSDISVIGFTDTMPRSVNLSDNGAAIPDDYARYYAGELNTRYGRYLAAYRRAMREMASAFPAIKTWEIQNERNGVTTLVSGPSGACRQVPVDLATAAKLFADVLWAGSAGIRDAGTGARSLMGGTAFTDVRFLDLLYREILSRQDSNTDHYFDAVAWHPYVPAIRAPEPREIAGSDPKLGSMYDVMLRYGDGHKPVILTEFGYSDTGDYVMPTTASRAETVRARDQFRVREAAFVRRVYEVVPDMPYVETLCWFRLLDACGPRGGSSLASYRMEHGFGLLTGRNTNEPDVVAVFGEEKPWQWKPAAHAYRLSALGTDVADQQPPAKQG